MTCNPHRFVFAVSVVVLLASCKTIVITESRLLRPMPRDSVATAAFIARAPAGYSVREHRVGTEDGASLYLVTFEREHADATVLYFGGNMFRVSSMGPAAIKYLAPLGVNLVLVDHRGYGESTGKLEHIAQLQHDALAVYDWVRRMPEFSNTRIIVHGQSLGSFLAGYVARERKLDGLVLEGSATTGSEWLRAADRRPWYLRLFTRLEIESSLEKVGNLETMRLLDEPLMILVGSRDVVMPPKLAQELLNAARVAPNMKRLHVLDGATHNDVPSHERFIPAYREFLSLVSTAR